MRKFRTLAVVAAVSLLLVACGNKPVATSSASANHYHSLAALVAAAKKEGSVVLYTDLLPSDIQTLSAAWKKEYPSIGLKVQAISGTDLPTRFESEVSAGTPSADVLSTALPDYYRSAAGKGLVVPLQKTGVLPLVPGYPKKYVDDDLDTALIQAMPSGIIYNTKKVPADKVPSSWTDLLDPFWKGHVTAEPVDASNNTNRLLAYNDLRAKFGADYLPKLSSQLGPSMAFQPMQAAVGAGQSYLGIQSLQFVVDGMKAKGAPVGFKVLAPAYWAIHGVGVSAKATHPAAARLLTQFLLTPAGSHSVSSGNGVYGPYDSDIPVDFKVPTYDQIKSIGSQADTLLGPFKK